MSFTQQKDVLLSVIIVSFKNREVIDACLQSIEKNNDIGEALEVIVVEQSPDDALYNYLIKEYRWVTTVKNENKGFGAGNNVGAVLARGKYLLFLNPDTILIEPVFGFALDAFENNKQLGMFGVRLLDKCGNKNRSFHFRKPYGLWRALLWHICDRFDFFLRNAMYIAGADMFMPASAFRDIGGFDQEMFMYFEETDLCNRLNANGYRIAYYPDKSIIHLEGQSSANVNSLSRQLDSLSVLCKKNGLSYINYLKRMELDRRLKQILGFGNQNELLDEISLIRNRVASLRQEIDSR